VHAVEIAKALNAENTKDKRAKCGRLIDFTTNSLVIDCTLAASAHAARQHRGGVVTDKGVVKGSIARRT
jgi:hypothetical protein